LGGIPKDEVDRQILLKSAVLLIGNTAARTEKEINEKLLVWLTQVCVIKNFDHVTLRRWLIDSCYLTRNSDGTGYQVSKPPLHAVVFEPSVDQIDILATIQAARDEMERRKQAYLQKAR
jgi:hypothetical protein